jgi:hypothetical protein
MMTTTLTFDFRELEYLVDGLALLRKALPDGYYPASEEEKISKLRAGLRAAMADFPQEWNPNYENYVAGLRKEDDDGK